MAVSEVESVFKEGETIIKRCEEAEGLLKGGYGVPREGEGGATLSPWESLYLVSEERLNVLDVDTGDVMSFQELLKRFRGVDDRVWIKYLIYRDLRKRGYVVRDGVGLGTDFRLYARGTYGEKSARYIVCAICEGSSIPVAELWEALFASMSMKKKLVVAVLDRRGEIVYYSLGRFG